MDSFTLFHYYRFCVKLNNVKYVFGKEFVKNIRLWGFKKIMFLSSSYSKNIKHIPSMTMLMTYLIRFAYIG